VHVHFSTVVWGPWHTGIFLDVNLPSLLAPENLAAFAAQHRVTYRILTSQRDIARITGSPAYQRAREIVPFELIPCPVGQVENPIAAHHYLWRRSIVEARNAGAMILFVPPDVVWSNSGFCHVADLISQGKRAVFITYMRVVSETCVPEIRRYYIAKDGVTVDISSRNLVELALQYIHPLTLTYLCNSPNFPIHPEFILWRVPGEGYLMRVLVREMFAYDPRMFELNEQALLAHAPDPHSVHYITDSDKLFALSFAPVLKDVEWYVQPQRYHPLKVGSWWLTYDSPANNLVASHYFYVHHRERTPTKWRRAERESDLLIRQLMGSREILRMIRAMSDDRVRYARQILSIALAETSLARKMGQNLPFTALIPRNAGLLRWLCGDGERLLKARSSRELIDLVLDHVLIGRLVLKTGDSAVLTTARGGTRRLTWIGNIPLIDDVALHTPRILLGDYGNYRQNGSAYVTDGVLPRSSDATRANVSPCGKPSVDFTGYRRRHITGR
jgi:hypothetical protein